MARRHNHYEAAFEDYVRSRGWPYVPVDEQRKAIFSGGRIKSFDFLVYRPNKRPWLVDVKGRKFPYESARGKRYWENWVTQEDLSGLSKWKDVFGDEFEPVLAFAYWLPSGSDRDPTAYLHTFRNRYYAFLWISATAYAQHARERSASWKTVFLNGSTFRQLVRPLDES